MQQNRCFTDPALFGVAAFLAAAILVLGMVRISKKDRKRPVWILRLFE
jgi:hypothetical protein